MERERFERIKLLFNAASPLSADERSAFLNRECAGDLQLHDEVLSLLKVAPIQGIETGGAANVVGSPHPGARDSNVNPSLTENPGTRIGPYKLLQLIGEGGFGSVFMAEQEKPVQRKVALKIIKLGMDTRQVVARFEQERQALAVMDHPNIAKVFDAGATDTGRPYFAMELVKGDPIAKYCDSFNLSISDRLELFAQVCIAVQHAHTKGIIHRDIKPSNILVSTQDGRPHAKVIDFGIAKATASKLTEKTLFTEHRAFVGTPEYMSPEQADGSLDIDTRTDVYSLGVLLYELLTGSTPFDSAKLRSAAFGEIQRIIREEQPPNPSTRLSQNTDAISNVAAQRHTEPKKLGAIVRGELDWIVMKALEKDRSRRYETANGLAADVRRYLSGESVEAAPASRAYRFRKFARRNRGPLAAAGAIAMVLCMGIVGVTIALVGQRTLRIKADRAAAESLRQRNIAGQITSVLLGMVESAQAESAGGTPPTVRDAVLIGSRDVDRTVWTDPETEANVRGTLASALQSIGELDSAEKQGRQAIALFEKVGSNSRGYAEALEAVANTDASREHFQPSIGLGQRAIEILDQLMAHQPVDPLVAESWVAARCNLATSMYQNAPPPGDPQSLSAAQKAMDYLRDTIDRGDKLPISPQRMASLRSTLGVMLALLTMDHEAEPILRAAMAEFDRTLPSHPSNATTRRALAEVVDRQGHTDEAAALYARAIEIQQQSLHPQTSTDLADTYSSQGEFQLRHGRFEDAINSYEEADRIWNSYAPDRAFQRAASIMSLCGALLAANKLEEAEVQARRAAAVYTNKDQWVHPGIQMRLARILTARARYKEAELVLLQLLVEGARLGEVRLLLFRLYTAWEQAEPEHGYGERAEEYGDAPEPKPTSPPQTQPIGQTSWYDDHGTNTSYKEIGNA